MLAEERRQRLRGVAGLGEDDDPLAVLDPQRLCEQDAGPAELRVEVVERLRAAHRLLDPGVADEALAGLRRPRGFGVLALALEVPAQRLDALGLDQLDGPPELHDLGVRAHPLVPLRAVVVDQLLELRADRVELRLGHARVRRVRHAQPLQFTQPLGDHVVERVADLDDGVGEFDALPLDVGVVGVGGHVGVVLGHDRHVAQSEVVANGQDLLLVAAGGGAHPGDERRLGVGVVAVRDVVVGVVAGRAVTLVEGEMRHVRERDAVADEVVFDHLRRRTDDPGGLPEVGAVVGADRAGEDDDVVVVHRERLPVKGGVLLDEWLRRREEQRGAAAFGQPLGGDEQADGRLAEPGRQADEGVVRGGGLGQAELVAPSLEQAVDEQRPLDVLRFAGGCRHLRGDSSFRRIRVRPPR